LAACELELKSGAGRLRVSRSMCPQQSSAEVHGERGGSVG
jgi:hypothetical protein